MDTLLASDIDNDKAFEIIPEQIYRFFVWILSSTPPTSLDEIENLSDSNPTLHCHALSVSQDLMFMKSSGGCIVTKSHF